MKESHAYNQENLDYHINIKNIYPCLLFLHTNLKTNKDILGEKTQLKLQEYEVMQGQSEAAKLA